MLSENDWHRLTRFVAGESSPFEEARTRRWIQENPERRRVYAELREIWSSRGAAADVDGSWNRLVDRLEAQAEAAHREGHAPGPGVRPERSPWRGTALLTRAAVIALLVVVSGIFAHEVGLLPSAAGTRWEAGPAYATGTGELVRASLPDGTEVVLGVRSRLDVASDFGVETRAVRLHGEAFFHVTPDPGRPFTVYTTEAGTRVLGTSFSVRSRGAGTEAVVQEGTVRIAPLVGGKGTELMAGQLGRVAPDGRRVEVARVDVDQRLAWLERRLVFRNVPFREILQVLELWYDIELRVEDEELAERRLSARLEHPPLSDLLTAIAVAADASYHRNGRTVTFVPKQ